MKLVAIVGSAVRSGKTRAAVDRAVKAATDLEPEAEIAILDLAEHRVSILDGRPYYKYEDDTDYAVETIKSGSAFLIASPIYRGTYTGALKNLLDHAPLEALEGRVVGLIATGESPHHYLAIDHQFRGLLAWYNSFVLPGSVYVDRSAYDNGELTNQTVLADLDELGRSIMTVATRLEGIAPKPDCLTRRMMGSRRG